MCGRFVLFTPGETLFQLFGVEASAMPGQILNPRYNIAPTQPVAAVRLAPDSGRREFTFFRWGLIPSWAKDLKIGARLINARAETVSEKPSFRAAFKRRRCLIPADGFFEWQRLSSRKQPVYVYARDGRPFAFAGLWETWHSADGDRIHSCTILTTEPNELVAPIHNRMPVIIEPPDYALWLDPGPNPELARHLLRPYPAEKMVAYPVSTRVNSPRNDDPRCIAPLEG
ncbi:MAG: SOS response-associated peptidase [Anaerolineae bacterium]